MRIIFRFLGIFAVVGLANAIDYCKTKYRYNLAEGKINQNRSTEEKAPKARAMMEIVSYIDRYI